MICNFVVLFFEKKLMDALKNSSAKVTQLMNITEILAVLKLVEFLSLVSAGSRFR